jgi:hypothetical protein
MVAQKLSKSQKLTLSRRKVIGQKHFDSISLKSLKAKALSAADDEPESPKEMDIDIDSDCFEDPVENGTDAVYHEVFADEVKDQHTLCIDFDDVYVITVFQDDSSAFRCHYEPPSWLKAKALRQYKDYINYNVSFIERIVDYINEFQSNFLKDPMKEKFIFNGQITQKAFVNLISNANHKFQESDFSNLCDKVWLIWPDKSLCLKSLFK